jgi:hypothetical protein
MEEWKKKRRDKTGRPERRKNRRLETGPLIIFENLAFMQHFPLHL